MNKSTIIIVFLLFCSLLSAENESLHGYTITLNTKHLKGHSIKVLTYEGSYENPIQQHFALIRQDEETIVFHAIKEVLSSPAAILLDDETVPKSLFMLRNNADIKGSIDGNSNHEVKWNDKLDRAFMAYQKASYSISKNKLAEKLKSTYKNEGLNLYLTLDEKINSKNQDDDSTFSKGINFQSGIIKQIPNLYKFLEVYFSRVSLSSSISSLLGTGCDNPDFEIYYKWILKKIYSIFSNGENVNNYITEIYSKNLTTENCVRKYGESMSTLQSNIEEQRLFPIGKRFPNFDFEDNLGRKYDLYKYLQENPNPTLLVFYAPDCSHCEIEMPDVAKRMDELLKKTGKKVNLIAAMYSGEVNEWKSFISQSHLENWENIKSQTGKIEIYTTIRILGTPTYLILNKNGITLDRTLNITKLLEGE